MAGLSRGVPAGARWTPVPDVFFARYLPALDDPVALKLALHLIWRLHRRPAGSPAALRAADLAADAPLAQGLAALGLAEAERAERLDRALERLLADGLLLAVERPAAGGPERWLCLNAPEGRAAASRLARASGDTPAAPPPPAGASPEARAYVFQLYEDNIGLLTPLLAEELAEAAEQYPRSWVERALRLAVDNNARRWSYIRAILERWARDGVDDEGHRRADETARERDSEGPYAAWIQR